MELNWIQLSIIRSILVVIILVIYKYEQTKTLIFPNLLSVVIGIISIVYIFMSNDLSEINDVSLTKLIITAIISFIVIVTTYYAIKKSPNPGLVRTFVGLEILILLIGGYFILDMKLSLQQLIGGIFVIIGILLIDMKLN